MEGGQCEFKLDTGRAFRPIFNPTKVASVCFADNSMFVITLTGREGIIYKPDTITVKGWIYVREPAVNYNVFPLWLPGDPERSQYIATPKTIKDLVCGCYAKKRKVLVEIDALPMVPAKAVQRLVTRA